MQEKPAEDAPGRLSSVASALMVLKAFSAEEAEIGISALGKRLGLAKSTVHRLAVTLASEGFLEQNPETGRYRLGLALFSLGALVRKRMDVSNEARPLLGAGPSRLPGAGAAGIPANAHGEGALERHHCMQPDVGGIAARFR